MRKMCEMLQLWSMIKKLSEQKMKWIEICRTRTTWVMRRTRRETRNLWSMIQETCETRSWWSMWRNLNRENILRQEICGTWCEKNVRREHSEACENNLWTQNICEARCEKHVREQKCQAWDETMGRQEICEAWWEKDLRHTNCEAWKENSVRQKSMTYDARNMRGRTNEKHEKNMKWDETM